MAPQISWDSSIFFEVTQGCWKRQSNSLKINPLYPELWENRKNPQHPKHLPQGKKEVNVIDNAWDTPNIFFCCLIRLWPKNFSLSPWALLNLTFSDLTVQLYAENYICLGALNLARPFIFSDIKSLIYNLTLKLFIPLYFGNVKLFKWTTFSTLTRHLSMDSAIAANKLLHLSFHIKYLAG